MCCFQNYQDKYFLKYCEYIDLLEFFDSCKALVVIPDIIANGIAMGLLLNIGRTQDIW